MCSDSIAMTYSTITLDRVKGCLVGALLGDCIGHVFEGDSKVNVDEVCDFFKNLERENSKIPTLRYSDDTAMLNSIAESLIKNQGFNGLDIAKKFVFAYFNDPLRHYGMNVIQVFEKLKQTDFQNIFLPALEQFSGSGSYGNGGAMRIAPVPIFCYSNYPAMLTVVKDITILTHTHVLAINGALLQAIAVHQSLLHDRTVDIQPKQFLNELKNKMKKIEEQNSKQSYVKKLDLVHSLLDKKDVSIKEVVKTLGNGVAAYESVVTAIYVFLRALNHIPDIESTNVVTRCIHYSILLGGDTDTIATMAGAIAGAFYGYNYIDSNIQSYVENLDYTIKLAEDMFGIIEKLNNGNDSNEDADETHNEDASELTSH